MNVGVNFQNNISYFGHKFVKFFEKTCIMCNVYLAFSQQFIKPLAFILITLKYCARPKNCEVYHGNNNNVLSAGYCEDVLYECSKGAFKKCLILLYINVLHLENHCSEIIDCNNGLSISIPRTNQKLKTVILEIA